MVPMPEELRPVVNAISLIRKSLEDLDAAYAKGHSVINAFGYEKQRGILLTLLKQQIKEMAELEAQIESLEPLIKQNEAQYTPEQEEELYNLVKDCCTDVRPSKEVVTVGDHARFIRKVLRLDRIEREETIAMIQRPPV